jgi:hypothetical protein
MTPTFVGMQCTLCKQMLDCEMDHQYCYKNNANNSVILYLPFYIPYNFNIINILVLDVVVSILTYRSLYSFLQDGYKL